MRGWVAWPGCLLSRTGRSNNESAAATQRYDGEIGERTGRDGEMRGVVRRRRPVTTERHETLKFRAAVVNTRRRGVSREMRREGRPCEAMGADFYSQNVTLWDHCAEHGVTLTHALNRSTLQQFVDYSTILGGYVVPSGRVSAL